MSPGSYASGTESQVDVQADRRLVRSIILWLQYGQLCCLNREMSVLEYQYRIAASKVNWLSQNDVKAKLLCSVHMLVRQRCSSLAVITS
jgi:hypothetical protein